MEKEIFEKDEKEYEEEFKKGAIPFFPNHILKEGIVACLLIALLVILTTFSPAPMEPPADPTVTPTHIKPEWYFLAAYQTLKIAEKLSFMGQWAPKVLGITMQGLIVLILFLLPFIDRNPERSPGKRPIAIILGILGTLGFLALTIWGYLS